MSWLVLSVSEIAIPQQKALSADCVTNPVIQFKNMKMNEQNHRRPSLMAKTGVMKNQKTTNPTTINPPINFQSSFSKISS